MAVLLSLAMVGAGIRYWAPEPSALRDVGTLLLVLWLPAVGNLVGFLIRKIPRRKRDFAPGAVFESHLLAQAEQAVGGPQPEQCTVVVGSEGFTARLRRTSGSDAIELQFLRPQMALAKLPPGMEFQILGGTTSNGRGTVLRHPREGGNDGP